MGGLVLMVVLVVKFWWLLSAVLATGAVSELSGSGWAKPGGVV